VGEGESVVVCERNHSMHQQHSYLSFRTHPFAPFTPPRSSPSSPGVIDPGALSATR